MKKPFLIFAGIVLSLTSFAQITITGEDMPQAGKAFIVGNDTSPTISLGTPGSSQQTWNFTSLTNHYYKAAVYDSSSITPYAAQFPTSNIYTFGPAEFFSSLFGGAPVYAGMDGYTYWKSDSTGLSVIGWNAIEGPYANLPVHQNPPELLIGAPATYGSTFNDTSRWTLFLGSAPLDVDTTWITNRIKTQTCDAWGQLNTPFGNFTDVIRIHENVTEVDSVVATFNSSVVYQMLLRKETTNNYIYLTKGMGYPLAIVSADSMNVVRSIEYLLDTTCSVYTKLMGTIASDSGIVSNGWVYLYQFIDTLTPMVLVDSAAISNNGAYIFLHASAGNYFISAQANLSVCATCIPTYSGNVNFWLNGIPLNTYCTDTILTDIFLTQLPNMIGNGLLSGMLQYGIGSGKTEAMLPVKNTGVLLEQISGGVKAFTKSDQTGNYSFANVPAGTYKITVDVPGLPMVSTYTVTVSPTALSFANLDFTVDTTSGSAGVHVGYPLAVNKLPLASSLSLYPNPAKAQFTLSFSTKTSSVAELKIYNALGQLVYEELLGKVSGEVSKDIHIDRMTTGIYLVQIKIGEELINKKLIIEND